MTVPRRAPAKATRSRAKGTGCRCEGFCPCERLARLGVPVIEAPTPPHELAYFDPDAREVVVRPGLSRGERRATLAHELVHAELCERREGTWWAWQDGYRAERCADEIAARQLLPLDALVDVLLTAAEVEDVAEALDVDPATVRARVTTFTPAEGRYVQRRCFIASHNNTPEGEQP